MWALLPVVIVALLVWEAPVAFGKKVVLFSEVYGVLVDASGVPQPDIRIERKWVWRGNENSDETVTGKDGVFRLPEIGDTTLLGSILPESPVVGQDIFAHGSDGAVNIWGATKHSYDANSEMEGRPVRLSCRIDQEPNADGLYWGTCIELKDD